MNKDIETLREAAALLRIKDLSDGIRAIADRMEQQSKAEPVAWLYHDAASIDDLLNAERNSLPIHSVVMSINRCGHIRNETPLYTHPPADALDVIMLRRILSECNEQPGNPFARLANIKHIVDAAIAAKEGK